MANVMAFLLALLSSRELRPAASSRYGKLARFVFPGY
jgi:hypothetical protein